MTHSVTIGDFRIGGEEPLCLIAGPCVIESRELVLSTAERLKALCSEHGVHFVLKSSFAKENRTSVDAYTGPGLEEGLRVLEEARRELGVPVLTDVHQEDQIAAVAEVVDVLQTPAFLCRQTRFIQAVASAGRVVNIKKGQFLAPRDMAKVVEKARAASGPEGRILVCERGATFGYNNLVSDMRSLAILAGTGCPVVYDGTHSIQLPGGEGNRSGGNREFVPLLSRAALAAGVDGLFIETHPEPDKALCDAASMLPLDQVPFLLQDCVRLHAVSREARARTRS